MVVNWSKNAVKDLKKFNDTTMKFNPTEYINELVNYIDVLSDNPRLGKVYSYINEIDTYLKDAQGCYVNYEKINLILYDSSKLETVNNKKQVLAEELGHYYGNYTYKFSSSLQLVSKQEKK